MKEQIIVLCGFGSEEDADENWESPTKPQQQTGPAESAAGHRLADGGWNESEKEKALDSPRGRRWRSRRQGMREAQWGDGWMEDV